MSLRMTNNGQKYMILTDYNIRDFGQVLNSIYQQLQQFENQEKVYKKFTYKSLSVIFNKIYLQEDLLFK